MRKQNAHGDEFVLYHADDTPAEEGDNITSFRGKKQTLIDAYPPERPGTTGYVLTERGEFYPSVFNMAWREVESCSKN